jgi:hypothetical protein
MLYIPGNKLTAKQHRQALKDPRLRHILPQAIDDYAYLMAERQRKLMPPEAEATVPLAVAIPLTDVPEGNANIQRLMERRAEEERKSREKAERTKRCQRRQRSKSSYLAGEAQHKFIPNTTLIKRSA